MDTTQNLDELRKSIDNIDNALIAMLAERFKITAKVGLYKAKHGLPLKDSVREAAQFERLYQLAITYGLEPEIAEEFLTHVIDRVIKNHQSIVQEYAVQHS